MLEDWARHRPDKFMHSSYQRWGGFTAADGLPDDLITAIREDPGLQWDMMKTMSITHKDTFS